MSTLKDNLVVGKADVTQNASNYFADEWRLCRVPTYRVLATIALIYLFAIGVDWIKTLCTDGMKIIFSLSLLCSCGYFGNILQEVIF
jgi:hypothetical protein